LRRPEKIVPAAGALTVMVALPVIPSAVADMTAFPGETPSASPDELTVATDVFEELHAIARPVRVAPAALSVVAASCRVPPAMTVGVVGVTVIVATGTSETVRAKDPDFPSLDALIVTDPTAMPVTTPSGETLAFELSDDDQTTGRPV
jgi:hypothetical protein